MSSLRGPTFKKIKNTLALRSFTEYFYTAHTISLSLSLSLSLSNTHTLSLFLFLSTSFYPSVYLSHLQIFIAGFPFFLPSSLKFQAHTIHYNHLTILNDKFIVRFIFDILSKLKEGSFYKVDENNKLVLYKDK